MKAVYALYPDADAAHRAVRAPSAGLPTRTCGDLGRPIGGTSSGGATPVVDVVDCVAGGLTGLAFGIIPG